MRHVLPALSQIPQPDQSCWGYLRLSNCPVLERKGGRDFTFAVDSAINAE